MKTTPDDFAKESGMSAAGERATSEARRREIELAAYYSAEKRGFQGDLALEDWLEAERALGGGNRTGGSSSAGDAIKGAAGAGAHDLGDRRDDHPDRIEADHVERVARELGVAAARLRDAIRNVGPRRDEVERFLRSQ